MSVKEKKETVSSMSSFIRPYSVQFIYFVVHGLGLIVIIDGWCHWCPLKILKRYTVLLNSDPEKKKLLHPKSIPTSQCYYCTLIFNNFEMFRKKLFEIKPQTGGVNA